MLLTVQQDSFDGFGQFTIQAINNNNIVRNLNLEFELVVEEGGVVNLRLRGDIDDMGFLLQSF